jgi:hypothetical protein
MIFLQDDESKQQFMMDTGAVCSFLPHRSKTPPTGPQLSASNGKTIPCWGNVRHRLTFGLHTFFVIFLLASRPPGAGLKVSKTDNRLSFHTQK